MPSRPSPVLKFGKMFELAEGLVPEHLVHEARKDALEQVPGEPGEGVLAAGEVEGHVDRQVAAARPLAVDIEGQNAALGKAVADAIQQIARGDDFLQHDAERQPAGEDVVADRAARLIRLAGGAVHADHPRRKILAVGVAELAQLVQDGCLVGLDANRVHPLDVGGPLEGRDAQHLVDFPALLRDVLHGDPRRIAADVRPIQPEEAFRPDSSSAVASTPPTRTSQAVAGRSMAARMRR